jgi:hypothetical protein
MENHWLNGQNNDDSIRYCDCGATVNVNEDCPNGCDEPKATDWMERIFIQEPMKEIIQKL